MYACLGLYLDTNGCSLYFTTNKTNDEEARVVPQMHSFRELIRSLCELYPSPIILVFVVKMVQGFWLALLDLNFYWIFPRISRSWQWSTTENDAFSFCGLNWCQFNTFSVFRVQHQSVVIHWEDWKCWSIASIFLACYRTAWRVQDVSRNDLKVAENKNQRL